MSGNQLITFDPRTGQPVAQIPHSSLQDVNVICRRANEAFKNTWRHTTTDDRYCALRNIADTLSSSIEEMGQLEAADTGKSLSTARREVEGAIKLWEYAATLARTRSSDAYTAFDKKGLSFTVWEPVGVVGMIVPWNYPLITTSERLPFALAAGCCIVLKPSELAIGSLSFLVAQIHSHSLLPEGVVQVAYGSGNLIGKAICESPDISMISFVGSTRVGRQIESTATALGKRVSSEMGGNNVVLVYSDADVNKAADAIVKGGFRNAGQACIAGTHVFVDHRVERQLVDRLTHALSNQYPVGSKVPEEQIQPMITREHKERVEKLIVDGIQEGLSVVAGSRIEGEGNFLGPVILKDVPLTSALFTEEIFGPVVTLTTMSEDDFLDAANQLDYGLAAYAWTGSISKAFAVSKALRVGRIWVNAEPDFWIPELPVGGFEKSGTGREMGASALDTYSLTKSTIIY